MSIFKNYKVEASICLACRISVGHTETITNIAITNGKYILLIKQSTHKSETEAGSIDSHQRKFSFHRKNNHLLSHFIKSSLLAKYIKTMSINSSPCCSFRIDCRDWCSFSIDDNIFQNFVFIYWQIEDNFFCQWNKRFYLVGTRDDDFFLWWRVCWTDLWVWNIHCTGFFVKDSCGKDRKNKRCGYFSQSRFIKQKIR